MTVSTDAAGVTQDQQAGAGQLEIKGVTKQFGEHTALDSLNLTVEPGEFLSLLGPSGCGKTTLLRIIAGFEDPTQGEVLLSGRNLIGVPAYRRPVNTVFQSYALFPHMSVADNVAFGLQRKRVPKKEIRERVMQSLKLVQMDGFVERKPGQLSGGQQQRVALARALVNRPKVLLLDEPMSALDRKLREEMQIELKRLHADLGTTFVFVTHDQEEALAMSDRIVVLNGGRVQQVGDAEEVYLQPANRFVAGFIGKQNFVDAEVVAIEGDTAVLRSSRSKITARADQLPATASKGDSVEVAIRPESMRLNALGSAEENAGQNRTATNDLLDAVEGEVVGVSFLGDVVQYIVRLFDGHEVIVRESTLATEVTAVGTKVCVSWGAGQVQVFSHER